jgi:hypothetical protein
MSDVKSEFELFNEWWNKEGSTIATNVAWRTCAVRDVASSSFIAGMRLVALPESELSTWKTRAEKAEQENIHLQNQVDYWKQAGLNESGKWFEKARQLESKHDTLKARCEKLEKEKEWLIHPSKTIQHKEWCELNKCYHPLNRCTCGLDELRKQGVEG